MPHLYFSNVFNSARLLHRAPPAWLGRNSSSSMLLSRMSSKLLAFLEETCAVVNLPLADELELKT